MKAHLGPEFFCGVAKPIAKTVIKKWLGKESQKWWTNIKGHRQVKEFLQSPSAKLSADLLGHDAKDVRIMVGLLPGLNRLFSLLGMEENNKYEGLSRMRFRLIGSTNPEAMSYSKGPLNAMKSD